MTVLGAWGAVVLLATSLLWGFVCGLPPQVPPRTTHDALSWVIRLGRSAPWRAAGFACGAALGLDVLAFVATTWAIGFQEEDGMPVPPEWVLAFLLVCGLLALVPLACVGVQQLVQRQWVRIEADPRGLRLVRPAPWRSSFDEWGWVEAIYLEDRVLVLELSSGEVRIHARHADRADLVDVREWLDNARIRARPAIDVEPVPADLAGLVGRVAAASRS